MIERSESRNTIDRDLEQFGIQFYDSNLVELLRAHRRLRRLQPSEDSL